MALIPEGIVKDATKPFCIVHRVRVKTEHVEDYPKYVREHYIVPANQEPGCVYYDLWQDFADPYQFVIVEHWATVAHLETHLTKPYVLAGIAKAHSMQDGEMQTQYMQSIRAG